MEILSALELSIGFKRAGAEHKRVQLGLAARFSAYVRQNFPIEHWQDLRPYMLQQFFNSLLEAGDSANYVRQYAKVIASASVFMVDNYPEEARQLQPYRYAPKAERPPKHYLTLEQWKAAVSTAHAVHSRAALVALVVGGLAGLRLEEICRLVPADLVEGVLYVHDSKTPASERLLPVCGLVRQVLEREFSTRRQGPLYRGGYRSITGKVRKVLDIASEATGDQVLKRIVPKDACRKTADNLLVALNVPFALKEGYLGHALAGVAGAYTACRTIPDDLPSVQADVIGKLRAEVVEPLDRKLATLNLPQL